MSKLAFEVLCKRQQELIAAGEDGGDFIFTLHAKQQPVGMDVFYKNIHHPIFTIREEYPNDTEGVHVLQRLALVMKAFNENDESVERWKKLIAHYMSDAVVPLKFQEEWNNGTGYLDGLVTYAEGISPGYYITRSLGRNVFIHVNEIKQVIVAFERYVGERTIVVFNYSRGYDDVSAKEVFMSLTV